jgi:hypothetical protein
MIYLLVTREENFPAPLNLLKTLVDHEVDNRFSKQKSQHDAGVSRYYCDTLNGIEMVELVH